MKENRFIYMGDREFEKFYKEYFHEVYKYVYRKILNVDMAEDVTQETFCVAFENREKLQKHPFPVRWLLKTAYYKLCELNRRAQYWPTIPLEDEVSKEPDVPEAVALGRIDKSYELVELEQAVLKTISEPEWQMFIKYYFQGHSISELAREKGITENNMRVRLSRIKEKLQARLGEEKI